MPAVPPVICESGPKHTVKLGPRRWYGARKVKIWRPLYLGQSYLLLTGSGSKAKTVHITFQLRTFEKEMLRIKPRTFCISSKCSAKVALPFPTN